MLVASGLTYRQAAAVMGVSTQTVRNTLAATYRKAGTSGLVQTMNRVGWVRIPLVA